MDAEKGAGPEFRIFYSYARPDKELRDKLESHLALLRQRKLITGWHDRHISGGQLWADEISEHMEEAQIILLLISDAFLNSDYCYGVEMARALEKHAEGSAYVIPIILRHVDWHHAPFSHLQALPTKGQPVIGGPWNDVDEAFTEIAKDIRKTVEAMHEQRKMRPVAAKSAERKASRSIRPGGMWVRPRNGKVVSETLEFAAFAYPTSPGDPPVHYVNFTIGWGGYWQIAQTVYARPFPPRYFHCEVRISELFRGIPLEAGELKVSFDVYDQQGNKNAAPHGMRTLLYRPDGVPEGETP